MPSEPMLLCMKDAEISPESIQAINNAFVAGIQLVRDFIGSKQSDDDKEEALGE